MSTLLEVSGVSVSFDGFKAINNLSINFAPTELRAIIGPNGAGKTTFMDIVTGKTKPDEGRVIWGDMNIDLLGMSESQIAMEGIGRKFQKPTVFEAQTVRQNLAMAYLLDGREEEAYRIARLDLDPATINETFTFYRLPREHHKHLRSTNMLERINQELKRRTHVVRAIEKQREVVAKAVQMLERALRPDPELAEAKELLGKLQAERSS